MRVCGQQATGGYGLARRATRSGAGCQSARHRWHAPPSLPPRAPLQEEDLKDSALLVFANKQDMRGALNSAQVSEALGLASIRSRCAPGCAQGGRGGHPF